VKRRTLLAQALPAASCRSVPLRAMWRLRGFIVVQMFSLDPAERSSH